MDEQMRRMFFEETRTFMRTKFVSTCVRKARNFVRRSWFEKIWFFPVWVLLGVSRFVILTVPFRYVAPWLGKRQDSPWLPLADSETEVKARSISKVVQMAANYTPWQSNCFPQAMTARILLGIYGIPYSLFFGLNHDDKDADLNAHAWVAAGRVRVTGGDGFGQFTAVGCFVSDTLMPSR